MRQSQEIETRNSTNRGVALITVIAVLTALGRKGPLREHVGLGLDNGLEPREICEGIIQCAIYAGFPSCIEAMEIAAEVFEERGVEA